MTVPKAFGNILKRIRLSSGLSQAELASTAKLDRTFISLMERGERQPTLTTIFQISKALKIHPSQLVKDTERLIKSRSSRKSAIPSRRI